MGKGGLYLQFSLPGLELRRKKHIHQISLRHPVGWCLYRKRGDQSRIHHGTIFPDEWFYREPVCRQHTFHLSEHERLCRTNSRQRPDFYQSCQWYVESLTPRAILGREVQCQPSVLCRFTACFHHQQQCLELHLGKYSHIQHNHRQRP